MKTVLITGANGFIGKNLRAALMRRSDVRVLAFDIDNSLQELESHLGQADIIYHLAGINRPKKVEEFETGNVGFTEQILSILRRIDRRPVIVFASSIQAELENPYGISKKRAEEALIQYGKDTNERVHIYRLANVFGKWSRPNYNSVVATFCHNIARGLPINISDPKRELPLVHVDDVVRAFLEVGEELTGQKSEIRSQKSQARDQSPERSNYQEKALIHHSPLSLPPSLTYREARPIYAVTIGRLAELIRSFRQSRQSLLVPDFSNPFINKLYGTFLSYLETDDFAYDLTMRTDSRGSLAEFVKSAPFGQIFVSRTKPGITRGNHYHHTKSEKFLVLEGEAIIRFRHMKSAIRGRRSQAQALEAIGDDVIEYRVSGHDFRVVDIPPGYTHSIENVGPGELVTLFWASEVFDPDKPDTIYDEV